jgi:ABC-type sulfate transport system permease component
MFLRRTLLKQHSVLPGFDLALGFTLLYLSFIVLIPLSAAFLKTFTMSWPAFWGAVTSPRVLASCRLTFGASLGAALINAFFGRTVAWVLVRYEFPARRFIDALVDLSFALPTVVAGIALTALYSQIRGQTNTMPLHIEILYNEYQFAAAFAMASLLALLALVTLGLKYAVEQRVKAQKRAASGQRAE